jgi:hypothetical protein
MAAGQDDAAMIDHLWWDGISGILFRQAGALNQRATAGGTPVRLGLDGGYGLAVAASSLHNLKNISFDSHGNLNPWIRIWSCQPSLSG